MILAQIESSFNKTQNQYQGLDLGRKGTSIRTLWIWRRLSSTSGVSTASPVVGTIKKNQLYSGTFQRENCISIITSRTSRRPVCRLVRWRRSQSTVQTPELSCVRENRPSLGKAGSHRWVPQPRPHTSGPPSKPTKKKTSLSKAVLH